MGDNGTRKSLFQGGFQAISDNYYNYFTEIEETFVRRRGKNLLLSPLDWTLIEDWKEREIPLHIVLRAIATVFDAADAQPSRLRSIKSLSYCKEEVEAQFAEWSAMQAGKSQTSGESPKRDGFTAESIAEHVQECLRRMSALEEKAEPVLLEAFKRAEQAVIALGDFSEDAEKIEANLGTADAIIDEALISSSAAGAARDTVLLKMESYRATMDRDSFERTLRLMLLKKIREDLGVPRFSLFYL
jgi:molybdopterin-guanine dinucleotide biosynthesis protein